MTLRLWKSYINIIQKKASLFSESDFDAVYREYPRKTGKTKGRISFFAKIDSQEKLVALTQAVKNYADSVEITETKFIKHFSTFMNCWEDYIKSDTDDFNERQRKLREEADALE